VVWNLPAFGPDVCLWQTCSTFINHGYFPQLALPFLLCAHVEALMWSSTVDLGHLSLDCPDLCMSYHVAPKGHIVPPT
jgi:hypothetical protein